MYAEEYNSKSVKYVNLPHWQERGFKSTDHLVLHPYSENNNYTLQPKYMVHAEVYNWNIVNYVNQSQL